MARKSRGDAVDGVLLLDKPAGLSSNHALQRARRLLGAAKAGHGGTLDPMATGLLPLAFGNATKFSADLLEADKTYEATLQLGVVTDTGDAEGAVTARMPVQVSGEDLAEACAHFTGEIEQVPPMHSAIKREGRPLYELARAGIEVERAPRRVCILALEYLAYDPAAATVRVRVTCSKGTYVRVLAQDIGARLGCGAHLIALRRERAGRLDLDQAVTLEQLEAAPLAERRALLARPDTLLATLPAVDLDATLAARLLLGQRLAIASPLRGRVRVYGHENELLGTARIDERGVLAPERLIATQAATS